MFSWKKWTANSNTGFFVLFCVFFRSLHLTGPLLLGGLVQLPIKFPVLYKHFTGCIRNVYINHEFLDLSQPLYNNDGTSAHINLAGEARVLTYLVLTGVTVPLGLMKVALKQVLNFFLRICNVLRTYYSLKRSEEYGIFWNLFKCLVSKLQTTVHELCMMKDTLWAFKCMRFLVMKNI